MHITYGWRGANEKKDSVISWTCKTGISEKQRRKERLRFFISVTP